MSAVRDMLREVNRRSGNDARIILCGVSFLVNLYRVKRDYSVTHQRAINDALRSPYVTCWKNGFFTIYAEILPGDRSDLT